MKPGGYSPVIMGETTDEGGGQQPGDTVHTVVANPITARSMDLDDMETDRGRARRPTMEPPRPNTCTCELPQCTNQMTEER